jgi:hypothetical protein
MKEVLGWFCNLCALAILILLIIMVHDMFVYPNCVGRASIGPVSFCTEWSK